MDTWNDNDSGMWYVVLTNHCHTERSEVSGEYLQGYCYRFLTTYRNDMFLQQAIYQTIKTFTF